MQFDFYSNPVKAERFASPCCCCVWRVLSLVPISPYKNVNAKNGYWAQGNAYLPYLPRLRIYTVVGERYDVHAAYILYSMRLARTPGKSRDQRSVRSCTPLSGVCFLGPFSFSCPFFLSLPLRPVLLGPSAHITFYVAVPAERRSCILGVSLFRVGRLVDISSACAPPILSLQAGAAVRFRWHVFLRLSRTRGRSSRPTTRTIGEYTIQIHESVRRNPLAEKEVIKTACNRRSL